MQELQNKLRLSNRENINRIRDFRLMGEKEKNKYYFNSIQPQILFVSLYKVQRG